VVVVGRVLGDGAEVIAGKELMDFVVVVLGVNDYCRLAFISFGTHDIIGFWLICLRMCNCRLCVVFWCFVLCICFSFLAASMERVL